MAIPMLWDALYKRAGVGVSKFTICEFKTGKDFSASDRAFKKIGIYEIFSKENVPFGKDLRCLLRSWRNLEVAST